jgi:hypothetical protein
MPFISSTRSATPFGRRAVDDRNMEFFRLEIIKAGFVPYAKSRAASPGKPLVILRRVPLPILQTLVASLRMASMNLISPFSGSQACVVGDVEYGHDVASLGPMVPGMDWACVVFPSVSRIVSSSSPLRRRRLATVEDAADGGGGSSPPLGYIRILPTLAWHPSCNLY